MNTIAADPQHHPDPKHAERTETAADATRLSVELGVPLETLQSATAAVGSDVDRIKDYLAGTAASRTDL